MLIKLLLLHPILLMVFYRSDFLRFDGFFNFYLIFVVMSVVKKNAKIYVRAQLGRSSWVIKCPACGQICASASERSWLPIWSVCDNKKCSH